MGFFPPLPCHLSCLVTQTLRAMKRALDLTTSGLEATEEGAAGRASVI